MVGPSALSGNIAAFLVPLFNARYTGLSLQGTLSKFAPCPPVLIGLATVLDFTPKADISIF